MKYFKCDRFGSPVDGYAAIITFFILGVLLNYKKIFLISDDITSIAGMACFSLSSIMLTFAGAKLKKKEIFGVKEIAIGSLQLYLLSYIFPNPLITNSAGWSLAWFLIVAFYLFSFLDGCLALVYSVLKRWEKDSDDMISRTESIVTIITTIPVAVFAGIQLLL